MMDPPENWYILYGRGGLPPLMGNPELDTQWLLLLCNTEDEALALSCRLIAEVHIVREIGTVRQDERCRTRDAAEILSHCAGRASTGNVPA
jgi:hypothetical protein